MRILMIALDYPPITGGAAIRVKRLSEGLVKNGHDVTVLTVSNPESTARPLDKTIKVKGVKVERVYAFEPWSPFVKKGKGKATSASRRKYLYATPCPHIGWMPAVVAKALRIIRKEKIDTVYTPYPVFTCLFIGLIIKKLENVKWIIDMHDSWYEVIKDDLPTKTHKWKYKTLENKIVKAADKIAVTTEQVKKDILKHHKVPESKFILVQQVVDINEIKNIKSASKPYGTFMITYTGALTESQDIKPLVIAANNLMANGSAKKLRIVVAGPKNEQMLNEIKKLDKHGIFEYRGQLPLHDNLALLKTSDVLFVSLAYDEKYKYASPSKMFEYLSAGKPLLGYFPKGEAAKFLESTKAGIMVKTGRVQDLEKALLKLYQDKKMRDTLSANSLKVAKEYDSAVMARKLVS